ncbi:MAG: NAD-dependent epimerase/dehydratase family protein [Acidisphaera sp.]|nr:NAD-dependent epimerase/dehydratase family protein [Acidisphaera sp.]
MRIDGGRFLLTGGASLIGSHLAEQLLAAGAGEVVLFDNYSLGSPEVAASLARDRRVRALRGDILRPDQLHDALDGVDGVFALAAFLTLPLSRDPGLGLDVNVRGMHTVLEACRYRGVKKLVFSSSVAVFGDPDEAGVDERSPLRWHGVQPALALYAASKVIGEGLCRLYGERHGIGWIALRYATVYGERQHHRGVNALHIIESYERIRAGLPPVLPDDGSEAHDYIHVADVARANVMAMASEVSGESFVIATGVDTSLNAIADLLLRLTHSDLRPEYRQDAGKVSTTTRPQLGFSAAKAKRLLGWEAQIGLEDGIARLIAWADAARA